jgi:SAM-dependent methyltransferase
MSDEELRFGFGKNWAEFIEKNLSDKIVQDSIDHMKGFMRRADLSGMRILDIGCGSGIHSLAMKRLGASEVVAFDYDINSVNTSKKVREWSGLRDGWHIEQGSVLDQAYMQSLGKFDLVYSWGVLHHTGSMWEAIANAGIPLREDSEFYIALYSSDNYVDPSPDEWIRIKKKYNYANPVQKKLMELHHLYEYVIKSERAAGRSWIEAIRNYGTRGMDVFADVKDWLGGYPMEFSGLVETRAFCKEKFGLDLVNSLNGEGCTEYLFAPTARSPLWQAEEARRVQIPLTGPFIKMEGYAVALRFDELREVADTTTAPKRSRLMLYEDGVPLGLNHTVHDHVKRFGAGRFSHWDEWLVFSASDNTDPNTNGRTYTYCVDY